MPGKLSQQQIDYEAKLARMAAGDASVTFRPIEFVFYLLDKNHYTPPINDKTNPRHVLSTRMGHGEQYLSGIFTTWHGKLNDDTKAKLAYITGKDFDFWKRDSFMAADADGMIIDLGRDASQVKAANLGTFTAQLANETSPTSGRDGR